MKQTFILLSMILLCTACGDKHKKSANVTEETLVEQQFSADSAFTFCQQQCDFGPRTMNSEAHEQCGQWIVSKFQQYGMTVTEQKATLAGVRTIFWTKPVIPGSDDTLLGSFRPMCF